MSQINVDLEKYPHLFKYSHPVKHAEREIVGREREVASLMAAFERPELSNAILLAPAGSGKTALIQETMRQDTKRAYLEVDLAKMIADVQTDVNEMAAMLKTLFDEVEAAVKEGGVDIVLFIDEFHQIVQLSPAAVEALKPLLADSGTRGIRVAAATTLDEFNKFISSNQPLVERLQRITIPEPDEDMTVKILRGMASRYNVSSEFVDDHMFRQIYEFTNRYIPANSQPRKSILVLDSMVGYHRSEGRKMDEQLLADVIQESQDVNVAFKVNARQIKKELDDNVLAQTYATTVIADRLQLAVAGLNDLSKPMATLLFTGSTGVGKTEMTKQLARILFGDIRRLSRFDMSEYANSESMERFRDLLTTRVWEHPYSIILLDEIEKSCAEVTRLLLQVIDDGRLSNRNNREVSFINSYIILTTNAASEIYSNMAAYAESESPAEFVRKYDKVIRRSIQTTTGANRFPPELLGRIDAIVPFMPLGRDTQRRIVEMRLRKLADRVMDTRGVLLHFDRKIYDYLIEDRLDTQTDSGGARDIMQKLEDEVTVAIAAYLNAYDNLHNIYVDVEGKMAYGDKESLISKAYISVKGM